MTNEKKNQEPEGLTPAEVLSKAEMLAGLERAQEELKREREAHANALEAVREAKHEQKVAVARAWAEAREWIENEDGPSKTLLDAIEAQGRELGARATAVEWEERMRDAIAGYERDAERLRKELHAAEERAELSAGVVAELRDDLRRVQTERDYLDGQVEGMREVLALVTKRKPEAAEHRQEVRRVVGDGRRFAASVAVLYDQVQRATVGTDEGDRLRGRALDRLADLGLAYVGIDGWAESLANARSSGQRKEPLL